MRRGEEREGIGEREEVGVGGKGGEEREVGIYITEEGWEKGEGKENGGRRG